jgi:tetratricopeptide (TPR) repeat protein
MNTNFVRAWWIIGALLIGFLIGGFFFILNAKRTAIKEEVNIIPEAPENVEIPAPSLPSYKGDSIDNIGTDPIINTVSAATIEKYKKELTTLKDSLVKEPNNFDEWVQVGMIKKIFNNYSGARDAWEYACIVAPKNSIAYFNLGGLYGSYLHEFEKAELNYLRAIENDSKLAYLYLGLADFYWTFDVSKRDKADDIIRKGLEALPGDEALLQALQMYTSGK